MPPELKPGKGYAIEIIAGEPSQEPLTFKMEKIEIP